MKETTYSKGNISEGIVLRAYLEAGFVVSIPFGTGAPYDLVVDTGSIILKVQVKTGWYRNGCIMFKGRRRVRDSAYDGMRGYTADEIDFFAIYHPASNALYAVPARLQKGDGYLRLEPVLNGQQRLIRWASDFTWEKHLAELKQYGSLANPVSIEDVNAC